MWSATATTRPQLVNMYGITETTVHVTYRPIRLADVLNGRGSVIGRPIGDLECYVLDAIVNPYRWACRAKCTSAVRAWHAAI